MDRLAPADPPDRPTPGGTDGRCGHRSTSSTSPSTGDVERLRRAAQGDARDAIRPDVQQPRAIAGLRRAGRRSGRRRQQRQVHLVTGRQLGERAARRHLEQERLAALLDKRLAGSSTASPGATSTRSAGRSRRRASGARHRPVGGRQEAHRVGAGTGDPAECVRDAAAAAGRAPRPRRARPGVGRSCVRRRPHRALPCLEQRAPPLRAVGQLAAGSSRVSTSSPPRPPVTSSVHAPALRVPSSDPSRSLESRRAPARRAAGPPAAARPATAPGRAAGGCS